MTDVYWTNGSNDVITAWNIFLLKEIGNDHNNAIFQKIKIKFHTKDRFLSPYRISMTCPMTCSTTLATHPVSSPLNLLLSRNHVLPPIILTFTFIIRVYLPHILNWKWAVCETLCQTTTPHHTIKPQTNNMYCLENQMYRFLSAHNVI